MNRSQTLATLASRKEVLEQLYQQGRKDAAKGRDFDSGLIAFAVSEYGLSLGQASDSYTAGFDGI